MTRRLRPVVLGLFWTGLALSGRSADAPKTPSAATAATASASPAAAAAPTPATVPLAEIAQRSQETITRVNTLAADSPADDTDAVERQSVQTLSSQVDQWLAQTTKTLQARPSLDALRDLQVGGRKLSDEVGIRVEAMNQRAKTLETDANELRNDDTLWTNTANRAKETGLPDAQTFGQSVQAAIKNAAGRIKQRQASVLDWQGQLTKLSGSLAAGLDSVRQANDAALKTLFVRDSSPLWARQTPQDTTAGAEAGESPGGQMQAALEYARQHPDLLGLHAAIMLVLLGLLLWLRRGLHKWTEEEPHLKRAAPVFEVPVATALVLSFLVKGPLYANAPGGFKTVLGAVLLLPMAVLLRRLLDPRLHSALYCLVLFYFVSQLRTAMTAYPVLERGVFAGELLAAILVFGWASRISRSQREADAAGAVLGTWGRFLCRLAILLMTGALAAEVLGYTRLGTMVGTGVLRSSYVAVGLYALLQVLFGLLLIALRVRPLSISHIARTHSAEVQQEISVLLRTAAYLGWFWLSLGFFQLQDTVYDWVAGKLTWHVAPTITVGHLLGFVLAIWLSLKIAQLLRFFLEEEVFERVHLSPGLPYAIATMLNYLVLFIGFLIALGTLGVGLNQITILAGAFSVGLGFGLQNIINNFVSGIILLFERPVKVGDIIQIGDATGEVRRIGIRASVIGIRDGSSIIVPNGNLISNQFTNWTYADRHRSIDVELNIASGPDPEHVLALLKGAAAAPASTKDHPAPEAFITALTAAGINVTVRAWISNYEDWVQTRSELTVMLVAALAREDIKLV